MTNFKFKVMDPVRKVKGYEFTGYVVSAFSKLDNQPRYVVECTVEGCEGILHIYNEKQLELRNDLC